MWEGDASITTKQENPIERGRSQERKGKGRDIGYALAVRSLRGSQQRGGMHHHGP